MRVFISLLIFISTFTSANAVSMSASATLEYILNKLPAQVSTTIRNDDTSTNLIFMNKRPYRTYAGENCYISKRIDVSGRSYGSKAKYYLVYQIPLSELNPDKTRLSNFEDGTLAVKLESDSETIFHRVKHYDGTEDDWTTDSTLIAVQDKVIGNKIKNAFNHLIKLCRDSDPF